MSDPASIQEEIHNCATTASGCHGSYGYKFSNEPESPNRLRYYPEIGVEEAIIDYFPSTQAERVAMMKDFLLRAQPVNTTAEKLAAQVLSVEDVYSAYMDLLLLIINGAMALDSDSHISGLVELLAALAQLPDAINHQSKRVLFSNGDSPVIILPGEMFQCSDIGSLWHDLPFFGWHMRDYWNGTESGSRKVSPQERTHRWRRLNTFCAMFLRDHESIPPLGIYWMYTIWTLRETLEEPEHNHQKLEQWIPATVQWFRILGKEIFLRNDDFGERKQMVIPGPLWEDDFEARPGFSRARWEFWKKRLRDIGNNEELSTVIHKHASDAIEYMAVAESQS